jgi:hypothetical protein
MLKWYSLFHHTVGSGGLLAMPTTPQSAELEDRVLEILKRNSGVKTRQELVMELFGYWPDNLETDKNDRAIRDAIKNLHQDWPILSSSSRAGYWLSEDKAEIDVYAAEQASRAKACNDNVRLAHLWPAKIRAISEYRQSGVKAEQPRML